MYFHFQDSAERYYKDVLFPELELVTEVEEYKEDVPDKSDREKLKDYKEFVKSSLDKGIVDCAHYRQLYSIKAL